MRRREVGSVIGCRANRNIPPACAASHLWREQGLVRQREQVRQAYVRQPTPGASAHYVLPRMLAASHGHRLLHPRGECSAQESWLACAVMPTPSNCSLCGGGSGCTSPHQPKLYTATETPMEPTSALPLTSSRRTLLLLPPATASSSLSSPPAAGGAKARPQVSEGGMSVNWCTAAGKLEEADEAESEARCTRSGQQSARRWAQKAGSPQCPGCRLPALHSAAAATQQQAAMRKMSASPVE